MKKTSRTHGPSKSTPFIKFNKRGHYTGYMKHAGTHRPVKKTNAEKIKDQFVKRSMDGSKVTSIEFDDLI